MLARLAFLIGLIHNQVMVFSPNQRARIQAESGCRQLTIYKYPAVGEASRMRIERACRLLDIQLPTSDEPSCKPYVGRPVRQNPQ